MTNQNHSKLNEINLLPVYRCAYSKHAHAYAAAASVVAESKDTY